MENNTIYDKLTKKYQNDLIKSIAETVSINSVYDETTIDKNNPFGKGVSQCLQWIAKIAEKDHFKVKNYDNMIVEIIHGDERKPNITILAHADIVPAGPTGWEHDPFTLVEKKGILYGRGVADDKGPLFASYYALKALRDNKKLSDNYCVRFLVGGNEESGSLGVLHYFQTLKKPDPTYGFSPDANFPIIYAEKGVFNFEVKKTFKIPDLLSIEGGVAPNSVIDECTVTMNINDIFTNYVLDNYSKKQAEIFTRQDVTRVIFHGKAAHGSVPELGINSGIMALEALAKCYKNKPLLDFVEKIKYPNAKGINATGKSKDMGHNSLNIGIISSKLGQISVIGNFRFVDTCKPKDLVKNIRAAFKNADKISFEETVPVLFYPKKSLLVTALVDAYRQETGDNKTKPLTTGGGTYAKEAKNVLAFGMEYPDYDCKMHAPGESIRKDYLFKGMSIYARAIVNLGKLIDENKI